MIKVCILDHWEFCDGEAYIFDSQDVDSLGETYDGYRPCEICHGSGNRAQWVGLRELSDLLERAYHYGSGINWGHASLRNRDRWG
jgi:hypothetical protein